MATKLQERDLVWNVLKATQQNRLIWLSRRGRSWSCQLQSARHANANALGGAMPLEMRKPWIGSRFGGLPLLEEVHYGDPNDLDLTRTVVQATVDRSDLHRFFTALEILVTGEAANRKDDESFWETVAFANSCPGAARTPRQRPSAEMWNEDYRHFPALMSVVHRARPCPRVRPLEEHRWPHRHRLHPGSGASVRSRTS